MAAMHAQERGEVRREEERERERKRNREEGKKIQPFHSRSLNEN